MLLGLLVAAEVEVHRRLIRLCIISCSKLLLVNSPEHGIDVPQSRFYQMETLVKQHLVYMNAERRYGDVPSINWSGCASEAFFHNNVKSPAVSGYSLHVYSWLRYAKIFGFKCVWRWYDIASAVSFARRWTFETSSLIVACTTECTLYLKFYLHNLCDGF